MRRMIVTMALYAVPFAMIYGSLELSRTYPAVAVFCAFLAGIVYAAVRDAPPMTPVIDRGMHE